MDLVADDNIRQALQSVIRAEEAWLGPIKAAEFHMLLNVEEYGVALEHLASYLSGDKILLSTDALADVQRSAVALGMQHDQAVMALARRRPAPPAVTQSLRIGE